VEALLSVPARVYERKVAALPHEEPNSIPAPAPEEAEAPREVEEAVPNIDLLILDLAHDDLPGNAQAAKRSLSAFLRGGNSGQYEREVVVTAANVNAYNMRNVCKQRLGFALSSRDHQQRQLAANILINCSEEPFPSTLSVVLVEALRYDLIDSWTCHANNEADAVNYIVNRPAALKECAPMLRNALYSSDGQQRFLAAFLLGVRADPSDAGAVCPLLFEQLKEIEIPNDEGMAMRSLTWMGGAALPYIEAELLWVVDEQARELLTRAKATITYYLENREASPQRGELYACIIWDGKMSR
jgi:hypothetical protein